MCIALPNSPSKHDYLNTDNIPVTLSIITPNCSESGHELTAEEIYVTLITLICHHNYPSYPSYPNIPNNPNNPFNNPINPTTLTLTQIPIGVVVVTVLLKRETL